MQNTIFAEKTFANSHKPRNLRKFSPSKVSRYTVSPPNMLSSAAKRQEAWQLHPGILSPCGGAVRAWSSAVDNKQTLHKCIECSVALPDKVEWTWKCSPEYRFCTKLMSMIVTARLRGCIKSRLNYWDLSLLSVDTYDEPEVILLVFLSEMNNQSLIQKQLTRWTQPKMSGNWCPMKAFC